MSLVRPRLDGDLPALVEVLRAVHGADHYPDVWPEDPHAFVATAAPLGAWVGRSVGEAAAQLAEIKRLFVSPSVRGLGLARRLMETALAEAARRRLRPVLQTLDENHAAIRFYEQGGWQRSGSVRADWTDAQGQRPTMVLFTTP